MKRRKLLLGATGLLTAFAGCNTITGNNKDTDSPNNTAETTPTNSADISADMSTPSQPGQLPPIWRDHSIENFQAQFQVETSDNMESANISNGRVQIGLDSNQWNDNTVTVQPGQMKRGEQEFTATTSSGSAGAQDTAPAIKSTPNNYRVDVVPQRNEELGNQIGQNSLEDNYLGERGEFITPDSVIDNCNSHKQLEFNKLGVDLAAYEWRHGSDYTDLAEVQPTGVKNSVDSIGAGTGNPEIGAIENGEQGISKYPSASSRRDRGSFQLDEFQNVETVGEALDWIHPYLLSWQIIRTDKGLVSAEDALYAPTPERATGQNTNQGLEIYTWGIETLDHGTGLIYDKSVDGSEELRFMGAVITPVTATAGDQQLYPLAEGSGYLDPENDGFQRHWHPLRSGWKKDEDTSSWEFEEKKRSVVSALGGISNSLYAENDPVPGTSDTAAPTIEYVIDFTEKLRNFNQNDIRFETLYNRSEVLEKMIMDEDTNHVIYGTTENPQYAVIKDDSLVEDAREDGNGEYDDFNQFLRNNPEYSMNMDDVDTSLEREEMDGFNQQVLAGA